MPFLDEPAFGVAQLSYLETPVPFVDEPDSEVAQLSGLETPGDAASSAFLFLL